jgi:hypothetical protein
MSQQIINPDSLVELSTDEQQLLSGGQGGGYGGGDYGGGYGGGWYRRCVRRCIRRCSYY